MLCFGYKKFLTSLIVISAAFCCTLAADMPQHILLFKISERAQQFPVWRKKASPVECVKFDIFQNDGLKKTLFADMRTKRTPRWPAECNSVKPYEFVLNLNENNSSLKPGTCTLKASIWGYNHWQKEISLQESGKTELNILLTRDPNFNLIISPRLMTGLTCLSGKKFIIEINAPSSARDWSVSLSSEYFSVPLKICEKKYGNSQVCHNSEPGWKLVVEADSQIPEDLYDLNVKCSAAKSIQPKSVRILKKLPDTIYIAGNFHHALDLLTVGADEEIASLFSDTINVINPVFYANVEDVGYEDERVWGRISYCLQRYLNVPYYHGLGNHDRGKAGSTEHYEYKPVPDEANSIEYCKYYCGMLYQSRDIGDRLHVVLPYCPDQWTIHNPRPRQQQWIKADLLAHKQSDLRLITCGHLTWGRPSKEGSYSLTDLLDEKYGLNLVLADDFHRPRVTCGNVPAFFGGLAKSPKLDEAGILEISRNKFVGDINNCKTYKYGNNYIRYFKLKKFSLQFSAPNDGSQTELTASVVRPGGNQSTIKNGRIRFILKKGGYAVDAGKIYQQFDSTDGRKTIVDVEADIEFPLTKVSVFSK